MNITVFTRRTPLRTCYTAQEGVAISPVWDRRSAVRVFSSVDAFRRAFPYAPEMINGFTEWIELNKECPSDSCRGVSLISHAK